MQADFARCCVIGPGADLQEGHQVNAHLGDGEHAKSGRHGRRTPNNFGRQELTAALVNACEQIRALEFKLAVLEQARALGAL